MNRGACVEEVQLLHASERDQLRPTTVLPPQRLKPRSLSLSLSLYHRHDLRRKSGVCVEDFEEDW